MQVWRAYRINGLVAKDMIIPNFPGGPQGAHLDESTIPQVSVNRPRLVTLLLRRGSCVPFDPQFLSLIGCHCLFGMGRGLRRTSKDRAPNKLPSGIYTMGCNPTGAP